MFGLRRRLSRIRQLEEALGWYADESHWKRKAVNPKGAPRRWVKSAAAKDRGGRARDALDTWSKRVWQRVLNRMRADYVERVAVAPSAQLPEQMPASMVGLTTWVNHAADNSSSPHLHSSDTE